MVIAARVSILVLAFTTTAAAAPAEPAEVVGGTAVPAGRWPDVVAVMLRGGACTGTLVAPDVVVTAAHCVDAEPVEVVVDTIDYERPGGERIRVAEAHAYPEWFRAYDVGVLILERPARVEPRAVARTCTADAMLKRDAEVVVVGFGATTESGDDPNARLREATIRITDPACVLDAACEAAVAPKGEFAAGGGGIDACFGDSGGPVFATTPSGPVLLGIVSRGLAVAAAPCGGGGVYVRADRVAAWIEEVTGRRLARPSCAGREDAPAALAEPTELDAAGGCTSAPAVVPPPPASLTLLVLAGIALAARRRRRAA